MIPRIHRALVEGSSRPLCVPSRRVARTTVDRRQVTCQRCRVPRKPVVFRRHLTNGCGVARAGDVLTTRDQTKVTCKACLRKLRRKFFETKIKRHYYGAQAQILCHSIATSMSLWTTDVALVTCGLCLRFYRKGKR